MSDRLRHTPDSVLHSITRHPRAKALGTVMLSAALTLSATPEGRIPLTNVKIGSNNPRIMEQLADNKGATLRGDHLTSSMPIGIAPIGEVFRAIEVVENGSWVKVKLDPKENLPDVQMNYDLLPRDSNGQAIIPTEVFIKRNLVKRVPNK